MLFQRSLDFPPINKVASSTLGSQKSWRPKKPSCFNNYGSQLPSSAFNQACLNLFGTSSLRCSTIDSFGKFTFNKDSASIFYPFPKIVERKIKLTKRNLNIFSIIFFFLLVFISFHQNNGMTTYTFLSSLST